MEPQLSASRLGNNLSNNDAIADPEPISPIVQVPVINEQAIIEAELDRTLEHVNNQLEQHQNSIRPSIIPVLPVNTQQSQVAATSEPVVEQQILGSSLAPAAAEENTEQESVAQPQNQPPPASSSEIMPNLDKPTENESEIFKEQKKALEKCYA